MRQLSLTSRMCARDCSSAVVMATCVWWRKLSLKLSSLVMLRECSANATLKAASSSITCYLTAMPTCSNTSLTTGSRHIRTYHWHSRATLQCSTSAYAKLHFSKVSLTHSNCSSLSKQNQAQFHLNNSKQKRSLNKTIVPKKAQINDMTCQSRQSSLSFRWWRCFWTLQRSCMALGLGLTTLIVSGGQSCI